MAFVRLFAVDHLLEHDACGNGSPVEPFLTKKTRQRTADLISDADDLLASTAAYKRLRDYGWQGNADSIKFARATAAALNAALWLAMEVSWLCPEMTERFGPENAAWPTRVATKQGISAATVVERWAAGFNYVLDLADEARRLQPHILR